MSPPAEASGLRLVARGLGAALVALAAIPAYLTLAPSWRAVGVRLASAAIVVAASVRVIRGVRRAAEASPPFALDAAPPAAPPPELDERFLRLRHELVFSIRSRRYFDTVLWPRLLKLAGTTLAPPPERRGRRRNGPSRDTLERLIAEVEQRP
jgi:hypothetical protein